MSDLYAYLNWRSALVMARFLTFGAGERFRVTKSGNRWTVTEATPRPERNAAA